jgi:hypothetical protein
MFLPISRFSAIFALSIALAACGGDTTDADLKAAEEQQAKDAVAEGKIECALAGSTSFERKCTTERVTGPEGQLLVIRHPDGGFRRFKILTDGRGVAEADGIEPNFKVTPINANYAEIRSGEDLYRIPARSK